MSRQDYGPDGHGQHPPSKEAQRVVDSWFTDWPGQDEDSQTPPPQPKHGEAK